MAIINLDKNKILRSELESLVDTEFSELISNINSNNEEIDIDRFFEIYDELFLSIPKEGDINSHRYILNKTNEYLGSNPSTVDVDALLQEITLLRNELLEANRAIEAIRTI